jgi:hypothetical protein
MLNMQYINPIDSSEPFQAGGGGALLGPCGMEVDLVGQSGHVWKVGCLLSGFCEVILHVFREF